MALDAAIVGHNGANLLEQYQQRITARKAHEAARAYFEGKITHERPDYLPICAEYSDEPALEFVPCAIQNPHDTCPGWTPQDEEPRSLAEALRILRGQPKFPGPPAPAVSPPAGMSLTMALEVLRVGLQSSGPPTAAATPTPAPRKAGPGLGCRQCRYYRPPQPFVTLGVSGPASEGQFRAALKLREAQDERFAIEKQSAEEGKPFDEVPHFYPWCGKCTPPAEKPRPGDPEPEPGDPTVSIAEIEEGLATGDNTALEAAEEQGLEFYIDYPNGRVVPRYVLCEQKNLNNDCKDFKQRLETTS
jgi:hypothetical protein